MSSIVGNLDNDVTVTAQLAVTLHCHTQRVKVASAASEIRDVNTGHRPHTTDGQRGDTAADQRERHSGEQPAMVGSEPFTFIGI